ncbi:MAG: class I SAM-dependent methyltransferase [Bradymonadaceae bacterium]
MLDTEREYYEEFADWYEGERHGDYDDFVEDIRNDLVRRYTIDRDVLDIGVGSGARLRRLAPLARRAAGVVVPDAPTPPLDGQEMEVVRAEPTDLPYEDGAFDVVYSFGLVPHLETPAAVLEEFARVVASGGHVVVEFDNPLSLRYLAHRARLLMASVTSGGRFDAGDAGRWDHYWNIQSLLPDTLQLEEIAGLRVLTPFAAVHDVPYLRFFVRQAEFAARSSPLKFAGGYLVAVLRKLPAG